MNHESRSFVASLIGDGRSWLFLTALCLGLSGGFAILQSLTRQFLPHDTAYLGMSAADLCALRECRIVHFMIHDRISFGGVLVAIAILYAWLAEFPLREHRAWAWWTLFASGITGFGSFLTYLGYGYYDSWHGLATLLLLPCFLAGLWMTRPSGNRPVQHTDSAASEDRRLQLSFVCRSRSNLARWCLLLSAAGLIGAGTTIQFIGMTSVFVPTDLTFMGVDRAELNAINPRLIPLIAHDRAGFGGALVTVGVLVTACVLFAKRTRGLLEALLLAGVAGWSTSIGVHPAIGYTDFGHLAPAVIGACLYFCGGILLWRTQESLPAQATVPLSPRS